MIPLCPLAPCDGYLYACLLTVFSCPRGVSSLQLCPLLWMILSLMRLWFSWEWPFEFCGIKQQKQVKWNVGFNGIIHLIKELAEQMSHHVSQRGSSRPHEWQKSSEDLLSNAPLGAWLHPFWSHAECLSVPSFMFLGKTLLGHFRLGVPLDHSSWSQGTESYHTENVGTTSVYPGIQSWCGGSSGRFQNFGSYSAMCLLQNSQLRVSWRELQQMQNQRIETQFWSHPGLRHSNLRKLVHMGSCLQTVHPLKNILFLECQVRQSCKP